MLVKRLLRPALHSYWRFANRLDILIGHRGKHIVICGYPRSGTSLLYNMIAASIAGFRCEEFEMEAVYRLHRRGDYVTKFPLDILNIEEILSSNILAKDIYFLLLVRDVRDLITSKHPLVPDRYFIGYKNSLWPQDPQFAKWNYNAPGIEAIHEAMRACAARRDLKSLKISYETLVTDTDAIQRQVEGLVGMKFADSFRDYYKRPHKHAYKYSGRYQAKDASLARESAQVDKNRISKWRSPEHRQVLREQFSRHPELFQILIEDGYEKDTGWFASVGEAAT
jgi:hypothetical protein